MGSYRWRDKEGWSFEKGERTKTAGSPADPGALGAGSGHHRYAPYVAGVIKRVLGNLGTQEDLEELSSDVFVALWRQAPSLREDTSLKLWLGVVARNQGLKHLRSLRLSLPLEEAILPGEDRGALLPVGAAGGRPAGAGGGDGPGGRGTGISSCATTSGARASGRSPRRWT